MTGNVKLNELKLAIELSRWPSMTSAADGLGIAQPTLSRCISDLEAKLGAKLFDRSRRGIILTPAGVRFVEQAAKALGELDRVIGHARFPEETLEGELRIGLMHAGLIGEALPALAWIAERHRGHKIRFASGGTPTVRSRPSSVTT